MSLSHTLPNKAEPLKPFITINVHSVEKFDGSNYQQWRLQITSLLIGFDLFGYVDGSFPCPPETVLDKDNTSVSNPAFTTWFRQDKLLFGALAGTLDKSVSSLLTRTFTSKDLWDTLSNTYALPSRGHIKQLKYKLKHITKSSSSISTYMNSIKSTTDELALLGHPISPEDITDRIIDGLDDPRYQPVIDAVNARDTSISFAEFHEKLINKELSLRIQEAASPTTFPVTVNAMTSSTRPYYKPKHAPATSYTHPSVSSANSHTHQNPKNPYRGRCHWCNVQGHTLAFCPDFKRLHPSITVPRHNKPPSNPQVHTALLPTPSPPTRPWLLDSGASHHVASDLSHLSLYYPYDGTDEIVIGDGTSLPITHTGSALLSSSSHSFTISNVFCVPSMCKNIISVSQFCAQTNTVIIFSPSSFLVKDAQTGALLHQGSAKDGVYYWSALPPPLVLSATSKTLDIHH